MTVVIPIPENLIESLDAVTLMVVQNACANGLDPVQASYLHDLLLHVNDLRAAERNQAKAVVQDVQPGIAKDVQK